MKLNLNTEILKEFLAGEVVLCTKKCNQEELIEFFKIIGVIVPYDYSFFLLKILMFVIII